MIGKYWLHPVFALFTGVNKVPSTIKQKNGQHYWTFSWGRSLFFENVRFYHTCSEKSCNERVSVLGYADTTHSKFRVSVYSWINTVISLFTRYPIILTLFCCVRGNWTNLRTSHHGGNTWLWVSNLDTEVWKPNHWMMGHNDTLCHKKLLDFSSKCNVT